MAKEIKLDPFRQKLLDNLNREQLLEIIAEQNPKLINGINRIEYVFKYKLTHLKWESGPEMGEPIQGRPLTNFELTLLIDEPFQLKRELSAAGLDEEAQRKIHIAKDPVTWARSILRIDGEPLQPRVYQILVLRHPAIRKTARMGRRMGKALDIETPIPTPDGWRTMKDLEAGDRVFDENGNPCNVEWVTDVMYDHDCYKIIFSDGEEIIADADHQWFVDTKSSRKARTRRTNPKSLPQVLTTKEMFENQYYYYKNGRKEVNYSIELAKPVQYDTKQLPIAPYTLGVWLGDGTSGSGNITQNNDDAPEVLTYIEQDGYSWTKNSTKFRYNILNLSKQLNELGIKKIYTKQFSTYNADTHTKFIPRIYLEASVDQRLELLKGLMDTDGSVINKKTGQVEFSICDERLAKDAYELINSLGFRCAFRKSPATLNGVQVGWRFRLEFCSSRPVFKLQRKLSLQKIIDSPSARTRCRYITRIEKTDSVPVKCIGVDSPNHLFLAGRNFITTHNSMSLAIFLLHYAYTHTNGKCLVITPMKEQGGLIYKSILEMVEGSPIVSDSITRKVTSPQHQIELSNGSTIKFFSSGVNSGGKANVVRGQEADVLILDELDYMHPDDIIALYAMLQRTRENQEEKILIAASTPTGQRTTPFYLFCHNPAFTEFWFPSMTNPMWNQETEDDMRAQYIANDYTHEFEADWGEDIQGVYPRRFLDKQFLQPGWEYKVRIPDTKNSFFVLGVDWDKYGAGVNLVILEICNAIYEDEKFQNKIRCIYREETPKTEFTYTIAVDRIIELHKIYKFQHIYVDAGAGECVSPETLISSEGGQLIPIKDIQVGNLVLAIDGEYHKVTNKIVRNDVEKETFKVRCAKNLPVEVSSTHPFLVKEKGGNLIWKNVTELLKTDKIASPKIHAAQFESEYIIDIVEYLNLSENSYGFNDNYVWALNMNGVQKCPIKRFWNLLSEDFLLFAGWYLSEGSIYGVCVELPQEISTSVGKNNCAEILRVFSEVTGQEPKISTRIDNRKESYKNINRYCVYNKVLALFLAKLLGNASHNKHIPPEIIPYYRQLGPLFRAMLLGDGHLSTKMSKYKNKICSTTNFQLTLTSFQFIEQMRLIFTSLGIAPSIYSVLPKKNCKPKLRIDIGGGPSTAEKIIDYLGYKIPNEPRVDRKLWTEDDNYIYYPIRSIESIGLKRGLIDIEVEGAESFVGNGLLLHNTQVEILHKHGIDHPETKLRKIVKRVAFGESIEITDPENFQKVKKPLKPFMVDNLHNFLEKEYIYFTAQDEELYLQLSSYTIKHVTEAGRPVFEAGGNAVDHAHDALILACYAVTENYGDLMRLNIARYGKIINGNIFQTLVDTGEDVVTSRVVLGAKDPNAEPVLVRRAMSAIKGRTQGHISRNRF